MRKIFVMLAIVLAFTGCTLNQSNQQQNQETTHAEDQQYANSQTEKNYAINSDQLNAFFQATNKTLGNKAEKLKNDLEKLKTKYPEGYYVIVKVGTNHPKEVNEYYDTSIEQEGSRVNLLIHELTHIASESENENEYVFQKDNLLITVPYHPEKLSQKGALRKYISKINDTDDTYLNDENGDIYVTLDELNAYTKSLRTQQAYINEDGQDQLEFEYDTTIRQILHLAIGLDYAKNSNKSEWNELTNNKTFAYILYQFKKEAEVELAKIELKENQEAISSINDTRSILKKYESVFDEFFNAANLNTSEKEQSYQQTKSIRTEKL